MSPVRNTHIEWGVHFRNHAIARFQNSPRMRTTAPRVAFNETASPIKVLQQTVRPHSALENSNAILKMTNTKVFFDITMSGEAAGRIEMEVC